jgi:peptidyl-Asp metalloendopeptidase
MGGTNAVLAEIELTQTVTNEVYTRSGVLATYRVVWVGEVNYAQTNDGDTDLSQLADGNDGILDNLHTIRDNENADFVTLWLTNIGEGFCGIAYCTPDAVDAFNVVVWDCAADNFSHPHEIGHNQGCDHNDGDGTLGCGEYDYSLGYRFFGNDNRGYRTVMAYDNDANTYTRIGYFSTPNRSYLGRNVGTADIDNTRSINNTRVRCESFQFSRVEVYVDFGFGGLQYGTFANPYAAFASAVAASREPAASALTDDQATIFVKPGTGAYAGTISKPMWIRACAGTANIGGNP